MISCVFTKDRKQRLQGFAYAICVFLLLGEAYAAEETPSIFTETKCFGSVKISKPPPMVPPFPTTPLPPGPPPVICIKPTDCQQTVSNSGALQAALNNADCGCEIVASSGNYTGTLTYGKSCPESSPLMIRSSQPGAAKISGLLRINGTGAIFQGFEVSGGINISGSRNRVTRTLFSGTGQIDFIEGASFNRIDHNDFILNRQGTGETSTAIAFYRPRSVAQMYNTNRIDSNFFTTNTATPSASVYGSAIFLCMYGAQNGYQYAKNFGSARTIIENNLFQNWGRKDLMEVKCSDNIFRNNTLINTGRVLNRHGGRNTYQNNIFDNMTTGLAIREYDNQIINNFFNKAKLIIYKGTRKYPQGECFQDRDWMPAGYQAPQGPPAVRTIIDKNRGALLIGDSEGAGCDVPVLNTKILCHEGSIQRSNDVGTTGPTSTSGCFTMPPRLTRNEAGRGAPETGCNAQ